MQRKVIATLVGALFSVGIAQVQAQSGPYYDPSNPASPTGITIGAETTRSIGCPGKGILDPACQPAPQPVAAPAPVVEPAPVVVPARAVEPAPVVEPVPVVEPAPVVAVAPVMTSTSDSVMYIPTGVRSTSALMIERMAPSEIVAGQPFSYDIKATNLTPYPLSNVVIEDICSSNFQLLGSNPEAERVSDTLLRWKLGELDADASRIINVNGKVSDSGTARNCMSGSYDQASCMAFNVVKPELLLKASAPAEVMRCDAIPLQYAVSNSGTGVARNAMLAQSLPEGISLHTGEAKYDAGDLSAGSVKEFSTSVMAAKPGVYTFNPTAAADPSMQASASATTRVTEPALQVSKKASGTILLGRSLDYDITVTNTGDAVARNLVVEETLPSGASVASVSDNGVVEAGRVVWNLPELAPKQSQTIKVSLQPQSIGSIETATRATAYCAADSTAAAKTAIIGIPAVLLEVIDLSDPIEIGETTTYVIIATNQGTATDINVRIVAELEQAMQFVGGEGATALVSSGNRVEFAPLPKLEPGEKAEWKVNAKAIAPSDHRFTVIMSSDLRSRPVMETEATTLYK